MDFLHYRIKVTKLALLQSWQFCLYLPIICFGISCAFNQVLINYSHTIQFSAVNLISHSNKVSPKYVQIAIKKMILGFSKPYIILWILSFEIFWKHCLIKVIDSKYWKATNFNMVKICQTIQHWSSSLREIKKIMAWLLFLMF